MKRRILSEKSMVVVLFVMVLVIFSFAQADTQRFEKVFLDTNPQVTTSLDQAGNPGADAKTGETKKIIPASQLR